MPFSLLEEALVTGSGPQLLQIGYIHLGSPFIGSLASLALANQP